MNNPVCRKYMTRLLNLSGMPSICKFVRMGPLAVLYMLILSCSQSDDCQQYVTNLLAVPSFMDLLC
jgi:hypothetical protein